MVELEHSCLRQHIAACPYKVPIGRHHVTPVQWLSGRLVETGSEVMLLTRLKLMKFCRDEKYDTDVWKKLSLQWIVFHECNNHTSVLSGCVTPPTFTTRLPSLIITRLLTLFYDMTLFSLFATWLLPFYGVTPPTLTNCGIVYYIPVGFICSVSNLITVVGI